MKGIARSIVLEGCGLLSIRFFGDRKKVQRSRYFVEVDLCQENADPDTEN